MFIKRDEYDALVREKELLWLYRRAWYFDIIRYTYSEKAVKDDMSYARAIYNPDPASSASSVSDDRRYMVYSRSDYINEYAESAGIIEEAMKRNLKEDKENWRAGIYYGPDGWKLACMSTLGIYIPKIVRLIYKAEESAFDQDHYENAKQLKRLIKLYGGCH